MKTNLITAFTLIALSLGVLAWQRSQLGNLRDEISATQSHLATPQSQSSSPDTTKSTSTETSKNDQTSTSISQFLEILSEKDKHESAASFFLEITRVLDSLRNLSSDELFLVLRKLNELETKNSRVRKMFPTLLMILADVEPERTLSFIEKKLSEDDSSKTQMIRMAAFTAWAEGDPQKAHAYLKEESWEESELMNAQKSILEGFAKRSLTEALAYLEDSTTHHKMAGYTSMLVAQDSSRREEIWQLLDEDIAPDLRNDLSGGLLTAILMESGLSRVDEALDGMKFASPQDRDHVLSGLTDLAFQSSPKEAMNWAQREFSPESQSQMISKNLRRWASKDFAAAGNWLKKQEPSPNKNTAIATYATTVAKLDPQSALAWADEITEQESLNKTRRSVLEQWHQASPQAATAWVDEKGLDREQWLPKD